MVMSSPKRLAKEAESGEAAVAPEHAASASALASLASASSTSAVAAAPAEDDKPDEEDEEDSEQDEKDETTSSSSVDEPVSDEENFTIEKLRKHENASARRCRTCRLFHAHFLVKWKNYDKSHDSWEPILHIYSTAFDTPYEEYVRKKGLDANALKRQYECEKAKAQEN